MLLERIVRPVLPVDSSASKTEAKCREPQENNVVQFKAPAGESTLAGQKQNDINTAGGFGGSGAKDKPTEEGDDQQQQQQQKSTEKTRNSSWAYAYKRYQTKIEKEQEKCEEDEKEDEVTGNTDTDDVPPGGDTNPPTDTDDGGDTNPPTDGPPPLVG